VAEGLLAGISAAQPGQVDPDSREGTAL